MDLALVVEPVGSIHGNGEGQGASLDAVVGHAARVGAAGTHDLGGLDPERTLVPAGRHLRVAADSLPCAPGRPDRL